MAKRRPLRRRFSALPFMYLRWLASGRPGALDFLEPERVQALWRDYGDSVSERHAARHPFTRPVVWWRYSAPERRDPRAESESDYLLRHPDLLYPFELAQLNRAAAIR